MTILQRKTTTRAIERRIWDNFKGSDAEYIADLTERFVDAYHMTMKQDSLIKRIREIAGPEIAGLIDAHNESYLTGED